MSIIVFAILAAGITLLIYPFSRKGSIALGSFACLGITINIVKLFMSEEAARTVAKGEGIFLIVYVTLIMIGAVVWMGKDSRKEDESCSQD